MLMRELYKECRRRVGIKKALKSKSLEEDKEYKELKKCLEIIPDDGDDVTIDATLLSTKSPTIIYPTYKSQYYIKMFHDVMIIVDYECEMAFELLRLVKKQLKEGYVPE
ncbi:hypothetical protein Tco_1016287 [Tanacetum coccineum]|uniref:Uncharacterized protein n=1 Tax=Tanacetum coccineum TaxID=301880 RepID=A0ABQ5FQM5_9ASTR